MCARPAALLFPGQASQYVGMARELVEEYPEAAEALERAENAADFPLREISFHGPEDRLAQTEHLQPCVLATGIAALKALQSQIDFNPVVAAGHSLGEYTALVSADSLSLEDAVALVRERGHIMQEAVSPEEGTMAALIGREGMDIEGLCVEASNGEDACWPANFNGPKQIVISGTRTSVDRAVELAKSYGVRRAVRLNVSAPFHCPMMKPAAERFKSLLGKVDFHPPSFPIIANVDGKIHESDAESIRRRLYEQFFSPVRFDEVGSFLAKLVPDGIAIEFGPGRVLSGLMRAIAPELTVVNFERPADIESIREVLR
jgi:[acyl-carrier-protein] S-malonyltransferase